MSEVTRLLSQWGAGDEAARDALVAAVYDELRRVAGAQLRRERGDHTLQATALVNEAYLRLIDQRRASWQNRVQFFAIAARLMRRVLVDHARRQRAQKRGGDRPRVTLVESRAVFAEAAPDLVGLDRALEELAAVDERLARLVELKFFAGLTIDEIAGALEVSAATVKRDWATARAWLYRRLEGGAPA